MKSLYISDLDGTLLRSDARTSEYTNRTINALVERGMLFSYATARSYLTACKVTAGLRTDIPLVVYNGAALVDGRDGAPASRIFWARDRGGTGEFGSKGRVSHCLCLSGGPGKVFLCAFSVHAGHDTLSGEQKRRSQNAQGGGREGTVPGRNLLSYLH